MATFNGREIDWRYCLECGVWRYFEILKSGRTRPACDGCTARAMTQLHQESQRKEA